MIFAAGGRPSRSVKAWTCSTRACSFRRDPGMGGGLFRGACLGELLAERVGEFGVQRPGRGRAQPAFEHRDGAGVAALGQARLALRERGPPLLALVLIVPVKADARGRDDGSKRHDQRQRQRPALAPLAQAARSGCGWGRRGAAGASDAAASPPPRRRRPHSERADSSRGSA